MYVPSIQPNASPALSTTTKQKLRLTFNARKTSCTLTACKRNKLISGNSVRSDSYIYLSLRITNILKYSQSCIMSNLLMTSMTPRTAHHQGDMLVTRTHQHH